MSPGSKSFFDRTALRFVGVFFVLVVGLTFLIQVPLVDRYVIGPYTEALAWMASGVLNLFESGVVTAATVLRKDAFAVDIKRGCDGVVATILLVSACLAYPFSWRDRLLGTLIGYGLIFTLNMIRIVALFLIGLRGSAGAFDFFHVYVSQFAVIAVTMVFWLFWAGRSQPAVQN